MLIRQRPVWPLQGGKSLTFILAFLVQAIGWSVFSLVIFLPANGIGSSPGTLHDAAKTQVS